MQTAGMIKQQEDDPRVGPVPHPEESATETYAKGIERERHSIRNYFFFEGRVLVGEGHI